MSKEYFLMKLKNEQLFLGNFCDEEDVIDSFSLNRNELSGAFILLAWYGYGDYDGSAFVLFERGGKLYEVNGGHCSCYGLEDQWDPEETSALELMHRIDNGNLGQDGYYDECTFGDRLRSILSGM
jgi:hypothetical protein